MTRDDIKQRITALHMEIRDYTRMLEEPGETPVFKLPYEIAPEVRKVIGGTIWSLMEEANLQESLRLVGDRLATDDEMRELGLL